MRLFLATPISINLWLILKSFAKSKASFLSRGWGIVLESGRINPRTREGPKALTANTAATDESTPPLSPMTTPSELRSLTSRKMKSVMILEALDGCMVSTLYENYLILLGIFPLVFFYVLYLSN